MIKDISGFVLVTPHSFLMTCTLPVKLSAIAQYSYHKTFTPHAGPLRAVGNVSGQTLLTMPCCLKTCLNQVFLRPELVGPAH